MWYVNFRSGEPNKPATMGGFFRADSAEELDAILADFETLGVKTFVEAK